MVKRIFTSFYIIVSRCPTFPFWVTSLQGVPFFPSTFTRSTFGIERLLSDILWCNLQGTVPQKSFRLPCDTPDLFVLTLQSCASFWPWEYPRKWYNVVYRLVSWDSIVRQFSKIIEYLVNRRVASIVRSFSSEPFFSGGALSTFIHLSLDKAGPFTLESHIHVKALKMQGFPNN